MSRRRSWKAFAVAGAFAATVFAANYVVPTGITIEVHEKRGTMWPVIGTLAAGQSPEIVREDGEWLIVRLNGKEGTVKKTAFNAPRGELVAQSAGSQASAAEIAAAGKGIKPTAIAYAHDKNLDPSRLTQAIDTRKSVEGGPWLGFAQQGSVGPFKK
jgi:hypothetical protein